MIRINLLPFRAARRKENIRKQLTMFFLSLILVTLVCWYYSGKLGTRVEDLNGKLENTRKEFLTYQKKNFEIAKIKRELNVLNNKIGVIETLESNREGPVRLLDAMTEIVIPKRMWFTRLQERETVESPEKTTTTINIDGLALDNKTVADFMERLEASNLFSSVNLQTLQQKKSGDDLNLKRFQINCTKVPLKTTDPADKAGQK